MAIIRWTHPNTSFKQAKYRAMDRKHSQIKTIVSRHHACEKIVLARESYFDLPDPWAQFIRLKESQPNNYHFLFSPQPNTIFLGASPEKLFSQTGYTLKTEALAGTRSVSHDQSENESLKQELNQSSKDQTEHHIVVHYIHTQIERFMHRTTQLGTRSSSAT